MKNSYSKKIKEQILNNSLIDKGIYLVGNYKGYHLAIRMAVTEPEFTIIINANDTKDENNSKLNNWLQSNKSALKDVAEVNAVANAIILKIHRPGLAKKVSTLVNENVEYIINYLESNRYITGCRNCGTNSTNLDYYEINGYYGCYCDNCLSEIENGFKQRQKDIISNNSSLAKGILGAILGSLIGLVIWVVIYYAGFIASLAGFAIAIGALKGYEKLGKHLDKKGVVVSIIVMIIMVWLSNKVACSLSVYSALSDYYTYAECFSQLNEILEYNDLLGSYYSDLIFGYFLTFIGSYKTIKQAFNDSVGKYQIKKVEKK